MLDLLSQTKIYAVRMSRGCSSYITRFYCPRQTSAANPLVATDAADRWDRQTDGRTLDRFMTLTAYYSDRVITLSTILDKV